MPFVGSDGTPARAVLTSRNREAHEGRECFDAVFGGAAPGCWRRARGSSSSRRIR